MKFLILLISLNLYAQDKVAFIIGDDNKIGDKIDTNMEKLGANTAKAYSSRGYKTLNLYGSEKRAKEMAEQHGVKTKSFSLETLGQQLENIYTQDCESRPKQLMLNFVAHGSYNGGNHILNTREEIGDTPVRSIAKKIRNLKNKNPECDKPILGIVDASCKSGGSIKEFEGLGCTLTTTSSYNQTSFGFIENYIEQIKSNQKVQSLTDLHLELLLNRDYELLEKETSDGKTILKRLFDNSNQIAGCYDENKGKLNIGLNTRITQSYAPSCEDPVTILSLRREKEINEIENIIHKLNISQDIDQSQIAKLLNSNTNQIPDSKSIVKKIDDLIKEDKTKSADLDEALNKESELMSHPEMKELTACKLQLPKSSKGLSTTDLRSLDHILTNPNSEFKNKRTNLVKNLCHIHSNSENFSKCVKNESSGVLMLSYSDLMLLQKDFHYLKSEYKKIEAQKSIVKHNRKNPISINMPAIYESYRATIQNCFDKAQSSSKEKLKAASQFIKKQYLVKKDNCSNEIGCEILKANEREKKLKNYFAIARAYFFLQCKKDFKETDDLKTCDDFKL